MQHKNFNRKLTVGVLFAAIAQVLWPAAAAAQSLPLNPGAMSGATAGVSGNTMTVSVTAPRAFINWNSFDVGSGYTFNANGPANFVLLNRVTGATFSTLDGNINSNGNIWVLNPNGVLVGGNARINVGGMLLSTAGLTDADFLDGNATYTFSGTSSNNVSVAPGALLTATSGGLYLQANQVSMSGGMQSAGTNAVIGSRSMVVRFDATQSANTSLDLGTGRTTTTSPRSHASRQSTTVRRASPLSAIRRRRSSCPPGRVSVAASVSPAHSPHAVMPGTVRAGRRRRPRSSVGMVAVTRRCPGDGPGAAPGGGPPSVRARRDVPGTPCLSFFLSCRRDRRPRAIPRKGISGEGGPHPPVGPSFGQPTRMKVGLDCQISPYRTVLPGDGASICWLSPT